MSVDVIIDSLKILAGKGVVIVCSAVFGIIIARLLLPGDRGILAVVMAVPAMLSAILQLGIRQSTVASYSSKQLRDSFKSELLGMLAVLCPIGALAALVALYSALPNDFDAPLWFVVIASMQVPISLCSVFSQGVYLGEKRLAEFNLVQWLPSVVTTAILCALYLAQCASLMAVLATIVAATAGVALYSIYKADLACRAPSFSWVFIKQQIAYGANASLALFVITVLSRATIVIVTKMAGSEEAGYFAVAVSVAELMTKVPTSFGIVAWVSRAHSENSAQTNRALRKSVRVSFTIVALVAIAIYVSADQVVNLFGDAYHHSAQMVRMLLPGYVLMSVFHIIHFDFTGRRTPQLSTTAASAGLLATLGGNLLLIPVFGGLGAAASTSLGYIVTSCVILWLYIKREGAHGEPT